jgi:transposase
MKTSITWSPGAGLNVVGVERRERAWTVTADSRQPTFCPGCGAQSKSRHSTYWRTLRDLSAQGAPVIVNARLGRWRCRNQLCDRRIFTERVPSLAAPFARRTARLAGIVRLLGHSAGGRPSERLMRRLGMPVSDTTILAGLRKHARARPESSAVDRGGALRQTPRSDDRPAGRQRRCADSRVGRVAPALSCSALG